MMDIPREGEARRRRIRRGLLAVVLFLGVALITVTLSRLEPAPPSVDLSSLYVGRVEKGSMVIQVRGSGVLVPEEVRWIPAGTEGQVERILAKPGDRVEPGTLLLELNNPQLVTDLLETSLALQAEEAEYEDLEVQVRSQLLSQEAAAATVQADYKEARLRSDLDQELAKEGLISALNLRVSRVRTEELATRHQIEQERLHIAREAVRARLAAGQARIQQLKARHRLRLAQVEALKVRAGAGGVLQQLPVEVGQRVTPGTTLALVADPTLLKAELRIPETQAKDVRVGQPVAVDTRSEVVSGRIRRIDPAVQEATVLVEVELLGPSPAGARPDLSVDGTIEIDRLEEVLKMGRPAFGQAFATISLFRILPDGRTALRTQVRLGRSSVSTIQVLEGLQEGDEVILSDISRLDGVDRIRLR